MGVKRQINIQTYIHTHYLENSFNKPGMYPKPASCGCMPGLFHSLFQPYLFFFSVAGLLLASDSTRTIQVRTFTLQRHLQKPTNTIFHMVKMCTIISQFYIQLQVAKQPCSQWPLIPSHIHNTTAHKGKFCRLNIKCMENANFKRHIS